MLDVLIESLAFIEVLSIEGQKIFETRLMTGVLSVADIGLNFAEIVGGAIAVGIGAAGEISSGGATTIVIVGGIYSMKFGAVGMVESVAHLTGSIVNNQQLMKFNFFTSVTNGPNGEAISLSQKTISLAKPVLNVSKHPVSQGLPLAFNLVRYGAQYSGPALKKYRADLERQRSRIQ